MNTALYFALWAVLLVGVRRWRIRRRVRRHICLGCGYDLSATAGGAPCPECGLVKYEPFAQAKV